MNSVLKMMDFSLKNDDFNAQKLVASISHYRPKQADSIVFDDSGDRSWAETWQVNNGDFVLKCLDLY